MRKRGLTARQISKHLNIGITTIESRLKEYGLKKKKI